MALALKRLARSIGVRRTDVAAARLVFERTALALLRRERLRPGGRTLCYHSVGQPEFGVNDVTPARFRRQIELSLESGRLFTAASRVADGLAGPADLAVTFDDGARSVLTAAAPILREHGVPFTVFVVGRWAEEAGQASPTLGWNDLEGLLAAGAEIGSHSLSHPDFGRIDAARAADELGGSRAMIEARLGVRCDALAVPYGVTSSWSPQMAALAAEAGYLRVYAQSEDIRPPGTAPRSFVTSFDGDANFRALLCGAYDRWQEWS